MRYLLITVTCFWLFLSSIWGQTTVILQPGSTEGKDTYLNSAYPSEPLGAGEGLVACAWTFNGIFGIGRSLIRFDLSQIPSGAEILNARLTLFFDPGIAFGSQSGENASYLERITEDWDEMTVTWDSQPMSTGTGAIFVQKTQSTAQNLANIDITGLVSDWVLHPETNFGMLHRMVSEVTYCCLVLASSDNNTASLHPKLVVTYRNCEPPVAGFACSLQIPKVNFSDTSNSASSWFWDFGDGYFSSLKNPQHVYASQGVYNVCLIISDTCGADTICKEVSVCDAPAPHFYYTADGQNVSFRDSSTLPQAWFWDFGDGFYSDLKNPVHFFNEPGTYYVCEKVTNACNEEVFCDSVTIISSAVNEHLLYSGLKIYPNPAQDILYLDFDLHAPAAASVEIFTMQGVSLQNWTMSLIPGDLPWKLNIAGLEKGLYLLQTKIDGAILLNKLIIL